MTPAGGRRLFMYLGFIDDSSSDDFQVLGGPVIQDELYATIELLLSKEIAKIVPEDQWDEFEFHTSGLFWAKPPFEKMQLNQCRTLVAEGLRCLAKLKVPIIYGAVDRRELRSGPYHTANPVSIAFQNYVECLEMWFIKGFLQQPGHEGLPPGLLICDDSGTRKEKQNEGRRDARSVITTEFFRLRKRPHKGRSRGLANFVCDDIYFGNSKNSRGIQLADMCVYFIAKHLEREVEAEDYYNIISDYIFEIPKVEAPNDIER